jgi:hypothetical protein
MPQKISPSKTNLLRALEARRKTKAAISVTKVPTRDRLPSEVANKGNSIRWFCHSCVGYEADGHGSIAARVRDCDARYCPLWPWRNGQLDERALEL